MPRKRGKVPSYCLHRASGRAVVRIHDHDHYLGLYGSPESHEEYERLIAEWRVVQDQATEGRKPAATGEPPTSLTINALLLRYMQYAANYYVDTDGKPTKEWKDMKYTLRPVRRLYGRTLVRDFGRWRSKRSVAGLRFGRTTARETEPIKPVPQPWVDAVVEVVSPTIAAMIQVQELAAMRPCEVVVMRACDLDMSGDVWIYQPHDHKNRWRGHDRFIPLGPQAQQILRPFLKLNTTAYLFSPREAEAWRNEQRRANRKTPMTPSQAKRRPKKKPKRPKHDHYDENAYRRAIEYGIKKANRQRDKNGQPPIPHWCPLQLRHSRATEIRKRYGIEAAQVSLGHVRADVTQVYAERNLEAAVRIARETG